MASESRWRYEMDVGTGLEIGRWSGGCAPLLSPHFHHEHQLTCVLRGCRSFQVREQRRLVTAGSCLLIPAHVPHRSLPHFDPDTVCVNIYFQRDQPSAADDASHFRSLVESSDSCFESVALQAARAGLSREAFTRKFTQQIGLPPAAFQLVSRLNSARRRLQESALLADVAVELGFSDQSHFGRHFKRAFGTTPAAYRDGMLASQTF